MKNEQGRAEIWAVDSDFEGKLSLVRAEVRETSSCYIFDKRLSGFGFVLQIRKEKVYLTAKAAIANFIKRSEEGLENAKEDIQFHQKNIKAARKLHAS